MRRGAALAALLALVAVSSAVAGCGGGGSKQETSTDAAQVLAGAQGAAQQAGTSKISFTVDLTSGGTGTSTISAEGVFDYKNGRGDVTFDLSDLLGGYGAVLGDVSSTEVILDGTIVYVKLPSLGQLLGNKPWLKVDLTDISSQSGQLGQQLQTFGQSGPSELLGYLNGVSDLQTVGKETIRGVETTHYSATIDFDKVLANTPEEAKAALQLTLDQVEKRTGVRTLPVDVWVGDDGLVRKMTITYPVKDTTLPGPTAVTMEYYEYGTAVDIQPPPADQVNDLSALTGLLGALGGNTQTDTTTTP